MADTQTTEEPKTTSDKTTTEQLKQKLTERIDEARDKLTALKNEVAGLHEEDMEALAQKREQVGKRLEELRQRAQKRQADIASWKQEKSTHTQDAIASWRRRREVEKLQRRADRARNYALDLVTVAASDFEEAEQAVLDALVARFDAELAITKDT
jgi:chromosome segregation ATPase